MSGHRARVGLCALCALSFSAFTTHGAIAQQAVTCGEGLGSKDFSDAHCTTPVGAGSGAFGHGAIASKTVVTITNLTTGAERSTAKLKSVQSGVSLELQATVVSGSGEMENRAEGATTWVEGTGSIVYENVTVTAPAGKGCKVENEKLVSNKLSVTSKGLINQLKITPTSGESFAEFTTSGCSIGVLNHAYTLRGSVTANTDGSTARTTHAGVTEANTLTWSGQKTGLDGRITFKGANGNALSLT